MILGREIISHFASEELKRLLNSPITRDFFIFLSVLIVVSIGARISRDGGKSDAAGYEWFQVIAASQDIPEVVVLRVYGDYLITAPIVSPVKQEGPNEIEKTLYILKLPDMSKIPLTLKKVGPLKLKE
jgi:hypothetical protein